MDDETRSGIRVGAIIIAEYDARVEVDGAAGGGGHDAAGTGAGTATAVKDDVGHGEVDDVVGVGADEIASETGGSCQSAGGAGTGEVEDSFSTEEDGGGDFKVGCDVDVYGVAGGARGVGVGAVLEF